MFKKYINKYSVFLTVIFVVFFSSQSALGFYGNDQETIDEIILEQELQKQRLDFIENNKADKDQDQAIKYLITAIDLKKDVADEKEQAYEKAINQSTRLIVLFGTFALIILVGLGIWHNKQLVTKKEELQDVFDRNIEIMKRSNEVNVKEMTSELREANEKSIKMFSDDYLRQVKILKGKIDDQLRNIEILKKINGDVENSLDHNSFSEVKKIEVQDNLEPTFD